jgi:hypothetical protein
MHPINPYPLTFKWPCLVNKIGEPHGIVYKNDFQYAICNPYLVSVVIIGSANAVSFDITIHCTTYIFWLILRMYKIMRYVKLIFAYKDTSYFGF